MAGDILICKGRYWMKAGWAFRGVLESAARHIPDSMVSLKALIDDRVKGWNYLNLEEECTPQEIRALLEALRQGYKDSQSAEADDPIAFASYMTCFDDLIRLIQDAVDRGEL